MKQIKIVDESNRKKAEAELTKLVNDGWVIVTSGGSGLGYIILQKG